MDIVLRADERPALHAVATVAIEATATITVMGHTRPRPTRLRGAVAVLEAGEA